MSRLTNLRYLSVLTELGVPFVTLPLADFDALLDVAEAAHDALSRAIPAERYSECIIRHGALGVALAPLVKEDDSE